MSSTVLDWSNRNMGQVQSPPWLKSLVVNGNSQTVKQEFGINNNARVKSSSATLANREEARVLATLFFNQQIATELKTYVVTAAAQTLNQTQMDIVEEITTATKVTITGAGRVADFWQFVERVDDSGARVREYIYYVVWSMEANIWDQLVRKYVNDVIGKLPDRQVQINIANAYEDIATASRREVELSDRDFQLMVDGRLKAAENAQAQEMARIRTGAQVGIAEAQADAAARYAAYRYGDPVAAAIASTTSGDIDWIKALSTAAKVIF
jgi:hypothetical protein